MEIIYKIAHFLWEHYFFVTTAFHAIWWSIADLKIQLYMEREGYAKSNDVHFRGPFYDTREIARKKVKTPEMKILMQKRKRSVRSFFITLFIGWLLHYLGVPW